MKRSDIKIPLTMSDEPEHVLKMFRDLVMAGESPTIAEICATRAAPGLETATNHYVGHRPLEETCGKDYARKIRAQALAAGIPVNEHSVYNGTVADSRAGADPLAWVHNGESPDKLRKACESRGKPCDDLRAKVDAARMSESEAKREAGIKKRNSLRAEKKAEMIAKRRKMVGA